MSQKIKTGDKVKILMGKDKGRTGKVTRVLAKKGKLVVEGMNIYKKHVKRQSEDQPGGIIELSRPMPIGKVALVCPKCGKASRVGFKISKGEKHRVCKKCNTIIQDKK